jgi:GxxExxY protein
MQHRELTKAIIGSAMNVHSALGPGFLESIYQNALTHELRKGHLDVKVEHAITVRYDGVVVGDFFADMLVQDLILVEIKGIRALTTVHEVQLVHYLTATGIDVGLLINFGSSSLEFRRKSRLYRPLKAPEGDLTQ